MTRPLTQRYREVMSAIATAKVTDVAGIASEGGVPIKWISSTLADLQKYGLVRKQGKNRYSTWHLTLLGKQSLEDAEERQQNV